MSIEVSMKRVRFLKEHRGYSQGEVALFEDREADALLSGRHAELHVVSQAEKAEKMVKPKVDNRPLKGLGVVTK